MGRRSKDIYGGRERETIGTNRLDSAFLRAMHPGIEVNCNLLGGVDWLPTWAVRVVGRNHLQDIELSLPISGVFTESTCSNRRSRYSGQGVAGFSRFHTNHPTSRKLGKQLVRGLLQVHDSGIGMGNSEELDNNGDGSDHLRPLQMN